MRRDSSRRWRLAAIGTLALLLALSLMPATLLAQSTVVNLIPSLSGTVYIEATANGGTFTRVEFTGSHACMGSAHNEGTAPYYYKGDTAGVPFGWDTTACTDGVYTLTATAYNGNPGTATGAQSITFRIANSGVPGPVNTPTPIPPTATRTATPVPATATPAPPTPTSQPGRPFLTALTNATGSLSGVVNLEAQVGVPSGTVVEYVQFDFNQACAPDLQESVAPYYYGGDSGGTPYGWDTRMCANGNYILTVRVYDSAGLADDQAYGLTINNTAATPTPTQTPTSAQSQPTLIDSYVLMQPDEGVPGVEPSDYTQTVYHPRQWTGSNYSGWDWMSIPGVGYDGLRGGDMVTLNLNRAARIGIVWRGGGTVPTWISSDYTSGSTTTEDSTTYPVYIRNVSAGAVVLGGVKNPQDAGTGSPVTSYRILLAESGGTPSTAPANLGSPAATPNATCPAWVHNQAKYQRVVDGVTYASWHRQIDPVYWCYFRHEHGSDPAQFGDGTYKPAFGRSAAASGIAENHEGFKVLIYTRDDHNEVSRDWLYTMHFGTVNAQGAACNRFHEIGFALADASSNELLADVMVMADMGQSKENTTFIPLNPVTCPGVNNGITSDGARLLPIQNGADPGNPTMYEPWRNDFSLTILGFLDTFSINNPDPIAICADYQCSSNVLTGDKGSKRFMNVVGEFGIDASSAAATGTFYTDAFARELRSGAGPGNLRQYIKPGVNVRNVYAGDNHTVATGLGGETSSRFTARFVMDDGLPQPEQGNYQELEGSLGGPN